MENEIFVEANQTYTLPILWTGEGESLHYSVTLDGDDAAVEIIGLFLGKKTDTIQATINVIHNGCRTRSNVILHGVLTDKARVVIDGLVTIKNGAKQSKARLDAHILLMSQQAKGRVIPSLEILENDVKAGHAATVGKIDPMQIFYLKSRGLSEATAKRLIVQGFLQQTIEQFPEDLQARAQQEMAIYV